MNKRNGGEDTEAKQSYAVLHAVSSVSSFLLFIRIPQAISAPFPKATADDQAFINNMSNDCARETTPRLSFRYKQVFEDLAKRHVDVDHAQEQLSKLGDSPASIAHWLGIIRWTEFLALEHGAGIHPGLRRKMTAAW